MSDTNAEARTGRLWQEMTLEDFGQHVEPVQGALFQAPDACGTLDLFDSE